MTKTLNDRFVAGLQSDTREEVFDTKTRGLVLRVGARGKVWYFVYRNRGPLQRLRLGEYPGLSLADARKEVNEQRALLDKGIDPVAERARRDRPVEPEPTPRTFTFADFVPVYVAFQKGRTKDWENEESKIQRHLLPAWGALPLRDIKRPHVHELLDTVVGKGLTVGVNRIQALISRMFTVALDRGLVDAHPAARLIKRFTETARDRVLSDDELRALWTGLDAQPGPASDAVRLRLLLGQRGGETAGMLWSELDLDRAFWLLPAPRTKNKRRHSVPLPSTALELLNQRRDQVTADERRVFPDLSLTRDDHRALASIHGGAYEWKDLRRTVGTRLAELGFDETTRGRVLNHARFGVTDKHYNVHAYDDEKRQALTAWDVELQRILANETEAQDASLADATPVVTLAEALAEMFGAYATTSRDIKVLGRALAEMTGGASLKAATQEMQRLTSLISRNLQNLRPLLLQQQLASFSRALEGFMNFQLSSRQAIADTAAWSDQLVATVESTAPLAEVEQSVRALEAQAPAILESLQDTHEKLQVRVAELEAELAAARAARQARLPKLRKNQQRTAAKQRRAAIAYANTMDARCRKTSDEMRPRDAVQADVKKQGARKRRGGELVRVPWRELSPTEQSHAVDNAMQRYRRGKCYQKEDESGQ